MRWLFLSIATAGFRYYPERYLSMDIHSTMSKKYLPQQRGVVLWSFCFSLFYLSPKGVSSLQFLGVSCRMPTQDTKLASTATNTGMHSLHSSMYK